MPTAPKKSKTDKEEDKKVKAILARLQRYGINTITEANAAYALGITNEDEDAFQLCVLLQDTYEGLVTPYNPSAKLLGAVNRDGVTCYLDALLFAMFARLDSFEAMLYKSLEDPARKRLAGLLRLWVNMLRSGRLITTDIVRQSCWICTLLTAHQTMNIQSSLAMCGWEAASCLQQQDTSEAFSFITDKLELPLLTLKMDMFHTGKDEPDSDHKFVNERLLEVAILPEPVEGQSVVTLEDCLESYFNNRVDVRRHLEQQRRSSINITANEKGASTHIETLPINDSTSNVSSAVETPIRSPLDALRSPSGRKRADSIFSQRRREKAAMAEGLDQDRRPSIRTEVLMPAFQFYKLLPWYTDNIPTSDAQVAAHFARKRPVLGICLKRYTFDNEGVAARLDKYVDIPLEIALPDFLSDDNIEEGSPLVGNFKLVLQSLVCHRGNSVQSGHYVALVRGDAANAVDPSGELPDSNDNDPWMLFDDLAPERVSHVNINEAISRECPYLLFYQVQPILCTSDIAPPSYDEAISRETTRADSLPEKRLLPGYADSTIDASSNRTSFDDSQIRSSTSNEKRSSITFGDPAIRLSESGQTTPFDDATVAPARSRRSLHKASRSRQSSQGPESHSRFALNMSKLTSRIMGDSTGSGFDLESDDVEGDGKGIDPAQANALQQPGSRPSSRNARRSMETRRKDKGTETGTTHPSKKLRNTRVPERDCTVM